MKEPRLKTVSKTPPPYPLSDFPATFVEKVGLEIVFMLATSRYPALEGSEWERIFAKAIDAEWKPSNVGLDDIVKGSFAWGAKTIKANSPHAQSTVRLISGRNNPEYSFNGAIADSPNGIGAQVLSIWNGRVEGLRDKFKELRTVVLIKPSNFESKKIPFTVFEFETIRYPTDNYEWKKNKQNNYEGFGKKTGEHRFTWQRHGSQFTILETLPTKKVKFFVKKPPMLPAEQIMELIGYDNSWIEIV
jgi:hypothetical protein